MMPAYWPHRVQTSPACIAVVLTCPCTVPPPPGAVAPLQSLAAQAAHVLDAVSQPLAPVSPDEFPGPPGLLMESDMQARALDVFDITEAPGELGLWGHSDRVAAAHFAATGEVVRFW